MKKVTSKVTIQIQKKDAEIIKEIIEMERSNLEAHRVVMNQKETGYEKHLMRIARHFA